MIKQSILSLLFFFSIYGQAQDLPYSWQIKYEVVEDDVIEVQFVCSVDSSWHIYSNSVQNDIGVPTSVEVLSSDNFNFYTELTEPQPIVRYDEIAEDDIAYHEGVVVFTQKIIRKTSEAFLLRVKIETQACQNDGVCTRPEIITKQVEIKSDKSLNKGVFVFFIGGLIAGFIALLTPCVFPMIPLTVTFFTKQAESKSGGIVKALMYGVSIVVIYVSLGFGLSTLVGGEALNQMASSAIFNLLFFVILIVFAISFLGVFEITLPASFVNKIDSKADKGGFVGIFFMALALVVVSFSCTGPVIGTLLLEAVQGGVLAPIAGMLGFSVALALPFTLFAIFPSWLSNLPKSGGWLNAVKVTLGFLELALALKFLSNADLVYQLNIITREVFIIVWIVIFFLLFLYLVNVIRLKYDTKLKKLSWTRKIIASLFLVFVIYIIPGLWGAPLKMLSGVLPPTHYTFKKKIQKDSNGREIEHCPNGLTCYHDYETAFQISKEQNKPVLLDFTGWTCVNCRFVEQNIWSDKVVDSLIRNHYVLASLYVDDRTEMPIEMQRKSKRTGKLLLSYGDLWTDIEVTKFREFTQPLYVLLDTSEQMLVPKQSYTTSVKVYREFLNKGIKEFNKRSLIR